MLAALRQLLYSLGDLTEAAVREPVFHLDAEELVELSRETLARIEQVIAGMEDRRAARATLARESA